MASFICDFCGKMPTDFSSQRMFKEHYKEHKGSKYPCDVCDVAFNTKQKLSVHIYRSHKDFQCEECHKLFSQYTNLKRHEKIHFPQEIVYKCESCDKKFMRKDNLKKHMIQCKVKVIEKTIKLVHKCNQCPKTFYDVSNFKKQVEVHIEKPKAEKDCCYICSKNILSSNMSRHIAMEHKVFGENDFDFFLLEKKI